MGIDSFLLKNLFSRLAEMIGNGEVVHKKRAHITRPSDVTSQGVRDRESYFPERLWNAEQTQQVLQKVLVTERDDNCLDPLLFPCVQTLLLFGRKGSGKNTILHTREPDNAHRFLYLDTFDSVMDWKMRAWNHQAFLTWAEGAIKAIQKVATCARNATLPGGECSYSDKSLLLIIQDVHLLSNLRDPVYMNTFTHIMTAIRMAGPNGTSSIRLVMTCADVPAVFPPEFRHLIDQELYVPLPTPAHCLSIMVDWLRLFRSRCSNEPRLKDVTWSIELDEEDIECDPDHIVNLLSLACRGTTPREIYTFMRRINSACSDPQPDGSTDVNEEFLEKMLYNTEVGKSIVPYNTEKENGAINKFLGIDFASAAGVAQGNPLTVQGGQVDPLNQRILDQSVSKKRKQDQQQEVPPQAAEALKANAIERAKILVGVEKRKKLKEQEEQQKKRQRDDEKE